MKEGVELSPDALLHGRATAPALLLRRWLRESLALSTQNLQTTLRNISIDETALVFYYLLNTGKEVIEKFMSSNHSEVAET